MNALYILYQINLQYTAIAVSTYWAAWGIAIPLP